MISQGVDQKPSNTALFAALRRTLACKKYKNQEYGPDYLAEIFLPPLFKFFLKFRKIRENTWEKLNSAFPGLSEYLIARTAYFDNLFKNALQEGFDQIVLLGAGYDTRAYRFNDINRGTRIFELDSSPTQERKLGCLRNSHLPALPKISFVPINFSQDDLKDVLEKAEYKKAAKTLFIWEGVSYYLQEDSVNRMLDFVSSHSSVESVLAFDYTISISDEEVSLYYGVDSFRQSMAASHSNEELLFSIPEGKLRSFLAKRGLKEIEHLNQDQIEAAYLTNNQGKLLGHMTGHFRFAVASPQVK